MMTNPVMSEVEARRLAIDWIYTRPHSADPERGPAKAMQDLRRLYDHKPSRAARLRRWRWADVYDLMWPLLIDSPTYAARIRRAVAAADRRSAERSLGRLPAFELSRSVRPAPLNEELGHDRT